LHERGLGAGRSLSGGEPSPGRLRALHAPRVDRFQPNDANSRSFEDCANQRNLTDKGRDEARAVGEHVKRLGIPVGAVLASPYCRTMETARLAFGKATPMQEVRGGPARPEDSKRYEGLKKLLSTSVPKGQNLVISSHGNPFQAVAGPPYLAEGEIAIVQPRGNGHFNVVARIRLQDWLNPRSGVHRRSSIRSDTLRSRRASGTAPAGPASRGG